MFSSDIEQFGVAIFGEYPINCNIKKRRGHQIHPSTYCNQLQVSHVFLCDPVGHMSKELRYSVFVLKLKCMWPRA